MHIVDKGRKLNLLKPLKCKQLKEMRITYF